MSFKSIILVFIVLLLWFMGSLYPEKTNARSVVKTSRISNDNKYVEQIPLEEYKGCYYINPENGQICDNLKSSIAPCVKVYEVDQTKSYIISGSSMAKFGALAGWYDEDGKLIGTILPHNGTFRALKDQVVIPPMYAKYLKIQSTSHMEASLYGSKSSLAKHDYSPSEKLFRERIHIMLDMEWTPLYNVPNNIGEFETGKTVKGLPYSSVKEYQKFIGLDVSPYTFLTAVRNPYSLLYTQNVKDGQKCYLGDYYHGHNCATFYGTVCSSFTAYCYGEIHNYVSENYHKGEVPGYRIKDSQKIEDLSIGDLWWNQGHVATISDVLRDEKGDVLAIELAESSGTNVKKTLYSPIKFEERFTGKIGKGGQAILYQKIGFNQLSEDHSIMYEIPTSIQEIEICTWFGDKPCIAEWDSIRFCFDKKDYKSIMVYREDELVEEISLNDVDHTLPYKHKGPGLYEAYLTDGKKRSNTTKFEVIDTSITLEKVEEDMNIIFPNTKSKPEIIYWVNESGSPLSLPYLISDEEMNHGFVSLPLIKEKKAFIRVVFKGKYGRTINKRI